MKWIICLTLLLAGWIGAQTAIGNEKVYQMEPMEVTAPRTEQTPDYVQDTVTEAEIQQPAISGSALDALSNEAGVQFQRGSLSGTESGKLRLRGFGETRLRILKDGVAIHRDGSYGNGPVDWSTLSAEEVEKIEIHRGAGPAQFGNTLGGVVHIITRKPGKRPKAKFSSVYGSQNTWDTRLSHAQKIGSLGWSLSASHYETDGYLRNNFTDRDNVSADIFLDLPNRFELGLGMDISERPLALIGRRKQENWTSRIWIPGRP